MSDPAANEMTERHAALLSGLAQMAYEQAQALHAQVLAAQTSEDAQRFATAFQKAGRAVRMCVALEAKEARALRAEARAEEQAAAEAAKEETTGKAAGTATKAQPRLPIKVPRIVHYAFDPKFRGVLYRSFAEQPERENLTDRERGPHVVIEVKAKDDFELDAEGIRNAISRVVSEWDHANERARQAVEDEADRLSRQSRPYGHRADTS